MNQQEIWAALVAGETVKSTTGAVVFFKFTDGRLHYRLSDTDWAYSAQAFELGHSFEIYKELEWYETIPIPKPVLCYVKNNLRDGQLVRPIKAYLEGFTSPYRDDSNIFWAYATPLTEEDWQQYKLRN